jgi:hypothetical protein
MKNKWKIKMKRPIIIALFSLPALPYVLLAQDTITLASSGQNDIEIPGTSSLHNWRMETKTISFKTKFIIQSGTSQVQSL